jgi:N-methylhydantoinase B/oxoprolinase/acetone carboxylase alpha subunit
LIVNGKTRLLPSKCTFRAAAGSIIRIETPGGGGWGKSEKEPIPARQKVKSLKKSSS